MGIFALFKSPLDIEPSSSTPSCHNQALYPPIPPVLKITQSTISQLWKFYKQQNIVWETTFVAICGSKFKWQIPLNWIWIILTLNGPANGPAVIFSKMQKRACRTIWTTSDWLILEPISGYQALFKLLQIDLRQKGTLTFDRMWHSLKCGTWLRLK